MKSNEYQWHCSVVRFPLLCFLDVHGYNTVGTASEEGPAGSAPDDSNGHLTVDGQESSIEAQEEVLLVRFLVSAVF